MYRKQRLRDREQLTITKAEAFINGELISPEVHRPLGIDCNKPRAGTLPQVANASPAYPMAGVGERIATLVSPPLDTPHAQSGGANDGVLGWGPNRDPIGRLKAMIEDKTWQPDMVESTRTSLYSLADALRRRPRRTTRQTTSRAVRSDHDRLSPVGAMLSKPSSKTQRLTGFLHIKRHVERAIL